MRHTAASHDRNIIADRAFEHVRERQQRKINIFAIAGYGLEHCLGIPQNIVMGEHDPFGFAGGAGSVDERRNHPRISKVGLVGVGLATSVNIAWAIGLILGRLTSGSPIGSFEPVVHTFQHYPVTAILHGMFNA